MGGWVIVFGGVSLVSYRFQNPMQSVIKLLSTRDIIIISTSKHQPTGPSKPRLPIRACYSDDRISRMGAPGQHDMYEQVHGQRKSRVRSPNIQNHPTLWKPIVPRNKTATGFGIRTRRCRPEYVPCSPPRTHNREIGRVGEETGMCF